MYRKFAPAAGSRRCMRIGVNTIYMVDWCGTKMYEANIETREMKISPLYLDKDADLVGSSSFVYIEMLHCLIIFDASRRTYKYDIFS